MQASQAEPPSRSSGAAAAGAMDFEAVKTALAQQSQQTKQSNAELRADLQRELRESNGRLHAELSEFKHQQLQAIASLTAQMQLLVSNNA